MGIGDGLYMYDVIVEKFTFGISSHDEFLLNLEAPITECVSWCLGISNLMCRLVLMSTSANIIDNPKGDVFRVT